jgi:hypothetical protein
MLLPSKILILPFLLEHSTTSFPLPLQVRFHASVHWSGGIAPEVLVEGSDHFGLSCDFLLLHFFASIYLFSLCFTLTQLAINLDRKSRELTTTL